MAISLTKEPFAQPGCGRRYTKLFCFLIEDVVNMQLPHFHPILLYAVRVFFHLSFSHDGKR